MKSELSNGSTVDRSSSDARSRQVRSAQVQLLYRQRPLGLLGALILVVAMTAVFWNQAPQPFLVVWLGCSGVFYLARYVLVLAFRNASPVGEAAIPWGIWSAIGGLINGLIWGASAIIIFPSVSLIYQTVLCFFLSAIALGSVTVNFPRREAYVPAVLTETLPLAGILLYQGGSVYLAMGLMILVYAIVLVVAGNRMNDALTVSLNLGFENQDLIHSLKEEKEETKRAEEALRKSEERWELALKGADLGLWDYNLRTGEAFLNDRRAEMVGYSVDELEPHISSVGKQVHPDDIDRVTNAFNDHVEGRTPFYESEHRLRHKSGDYIWVLARGKVVDRDEQGYPVRVLGTTLDITDRRRAEEALQSAHNELERRVEERTAELRETNEQLIVEMAERKQAEELLTESEARYRLVVENANELIGVVQDGRFVFSNPRGLELSGYSEEEVTSMPFLELVHPDDRQRAFQLHQEAMEGKGATKAVVFRVIDKWGNVRWGHVSAVRIEWHGRVAVLVFGIEITELKQAEEALRESEHRFRGLAEEAPFGLVLIKEDGTLQYINPKFRELFGYALEDVPNGREWFRRAYPDTKYRHNVISTWIDDARRAKTGQVRPRIFTVRCRDGSEKAVSFIPLSLPSGEDMVTCEDVTERRRAEELAMRTERLKAIGDLAGGVAHNFNNLLQMVMGGIDLSLVDLEMGNMSDAKKTLEQLLQVSKSGATTVRRLQTFAQVSGKIQPGEAQVFDLSETVKQTAEITKPFWKTGPAKEGIRVLLNLELMERCFVNAKESEITEVLVNLVKNAAEALPTGGEIRIKTFFREDQVILQVMDTGVGIKREHLKKVLEPFWSTKGVSAGTGMGLAVSHGIISRHGGIISVESEEAKGTIFTVTLPLAAEPQEVPLASDAKMLRTKLNILVIDDMAIIVMHLEGILTKYRQTVFSATSGEEALEIFRNNRIDMVICDLSMPGMNGWEVGKAIRAICQERGLPKTPFILLTGWGGQELEQEKIIESAVDAIVEKPIDNKMLMAVVGKMAEMVLPEESKRTSPSKL
ncbi:MAG: PAS domain S-box protein [Desulfomonilaceae bacterium]